MNRALMGHSYATADNARKVLERNASMIGDATAIVAVNDAGRFVPVVIYSHNVKHLPIRALCDNKITVLS